MDRLMGVETEYALVGFLKNGGSMDPELFAKNFMRTARDRLVHLREPGGNGIFLGNGARLYVDAGFHPEIATPECSDPTEVVRYIEAGERILAHVADALTGQRPDLDQTLGFKCNVDYSPDSRSTWGCHESYMHTMDPESLPPQVIPHLVSRIVYTGAGGFNSLKESAEFLLSPRAPHLVAASSANSTSQRGIFHTKDEPLTRGDYHRLHVISGESLCSRLGSWLKVGTTALVVAMSEAGLVPGAGVGLEDPVRALRSIAADPTCTAAVPVAGRGRMTAIQIQRHYLESALAHLDDPHMPGWAPAVCDEWARVLTDLEKGPDAVARRLDWAIKWALYSDHIEKAGCGWTRLPAEVKHQLFEIDVRFGQIGGQGIFRQLDEGGVLDCGATGVGDIASAMSDPPARGRARLRGEWVVRLAGQKDKGVVCDWQVIVHRSRRLDLSDPFKTDVEWVECEVNEPLRSLFDVIGL